MRVPVGGGGGAVAVIMLSETLCCPSLLGPLGGRWPMLAEGAIALCTTAIGAGEGTVVSTGATGDVAMVG